MLGRDLLGAPDGRVFEMTSGKGRGRRFKKEGSAFREVWVAGVTGPTKEAPSVWRGRTVSALELLATRPELVWP